MNAQKNSAAKLTMLVVDDEPDLCDMLAAYMSKQGFLVICSGNTTQARETIQAENIDIMILDINMPGESGLDLLRSLQSDSKFPIILLTANSEIVDRVVGLELGADDYVGKPFDLRELLARVRRVLRRTERADDKPADTAQVKESDQPNRVKFGDCTLDLNERRLYNVLNEELPLTAMEFDLLNFFAENPNRVLTRDRLLELTYYRGRDPFDRSIDIRITRLRRKIEKDPSHPQVIKTVRGSGYLFSSHSKDNP